MSVVRLGLTALVMTLTAVVLLVLAGDPLATFPTLRRAPEVAARRNAEDVVLALTGLLAWVTWAWGALGLVLTAVSGLPGVPGAVARGASRVLLPQRLRTATALALGVTLAVAGPAAAVPGTPSGPGDRPATVTGSPGPPAEPAGPPDWPADPAAPPPADPAAPPPAGPPERHVVVPGDCLWRIAADHLDRSGPPPTDGEIARAVTAWWSVNSAVVGPDPDLVHPGQVLQAPPTTSDSPGGSR